MKKFCVINLLFFWLFYIGTRFIRPLLFSIDIHLNKIYLFLVELKYSFRFV